MRWKSTLALLVAAVGIGAYISLYELKQPTPQQRRRQSKYVVDLEPDAVTQIVLGLPQTQSTLTRQGSNWLINPDNTRADSGLINELLRELSPLASERILTATAQKPLELAAFGLNPPAGSIAVTANSAVTTLLFGGATPIGRSRYVKLSEKSEVFVVPAKLFDSANQPAESFRDKTLLPVNARLCEALELKSSGSSWQALREDQLWSLKQPFADKADNQAISLLLASIGRLKIEKFIQDASNPDQLSIWGLDKPATEIILRFEAAAGPTALMFGSPLSEDASLVYAKRSDEAAIYAVSAKSMESLLKKPEELRLKEEPAEVSENPS